MTSRFDRGDLLRIDTTFTDTEGDPVDPDTVTFLTLIDGVQSEYVFDIDDEVTRVETGHYRAMVSLDTVGKLWVRVEATGNGQAAAERRISVVSAFRS